MHQHKILGVLTSIELAVFAIPSVLPYSQDSDGMELADDLLLRERLI